MQVKRFDTRIQLKYDTYQNWTTNNPILLSGEIAICVSSNPNKVRLKSGNGTDHFNDLEWISAKAIEVVDTNTQYQIIQDELDPETIVLQYREWDAATQTFSQWVTQNTITIPSILRWKTF